MPPILCANGKVLRSLPMAEAILTGISDLDLLLAHHTLLLPSTQRICPQGGSQQGLRGSDGSFLPFDEPRLLPRKNRLGTWRPAQSQFPDWRRYAQNVPASSGPSKWSVSREQSHILLVVQMAVIIGTRPLAANRLLSLLHLFRATDASQLHKVGSNLKRIGSFQQMTE
jgi:hypothetical protein